MDDHTTTLTGLHELQPADWADRLERLPTEDAREILNGLPAPKVAAILSELPSKEAARLLEEFPEDQIVAWLQMLPSHVAADLADSFPASRRKDLLAALPPDQSAAVMALLRYPSDSAGGIMDNRFIAMRADQTVEACLAELRASPRQRTDDVLYVYVTDDARRLVGVVSLRELVFAPAERRLSEIMNQEVRFLRVTDDQEEIARQLRIPMKADTCSNPYRTPFRSCRTVVGAKRRSEGVIKRCPTGVKVSPQFWCSFGAPPRGDDWTFNPRASSRRLFGRAVSGGNGLSNSSSRCRRSLRVTDSFARPNRRACD